jgi:hypothetical protein
MVEYIKNYNYTFDKLENKGKSVVKTPEGNKEVTVYQLSLSLEDIKNLLKHTNGTVEEMINDGSLKELAEEIITITYNSLTDVQKEGTLEEALAEFNTSFDQFKTEYASQGGKELVDQQINQIFTMIDQYCELGSKGFVLSYGIDNEDNVISEDLVLNLVLKNPHVYMGLPLAAGAQESKIDVALSINSLMYNINKTKVTIPEFSEDEVIPFTEYLKTNEAFMNSPYASALGVGKKTIMLSIGEKTAFVSGEGSIDLDAEPFIQDESTMVPVRFVGETLGATVDWRDEDKAVIYNDGSKNIELYIGSKTAYVNGVAYELPTAPVIVNGSTMVPLRFVSEQLGATVNWNEELKMITIEK